MVGAVTGGGLTTVRVKDWVAGDPIPLVAVKVTGKEPVADGMPDSTPVAARR